MIQVPITNDPNQTLSITIPLITGNQTFQFIVRWNRAALYWQLTVSQRGSILINNLPLITGLGLTVNILAQYAYLGIGNAYVLAVGKPASDYPQVGDWGTSFFLLWE